jgi:hypothetical protein
MVNKTERALAKAFTREKTSFDTTSCLSVNPTWLTNTIIVVPRYCPTIQRIWEALRIPPPDLECGEWDLKAYKKWVPCKDRVTVLMDTLLAAPDWTPATDTKLEFEDSDVHERIFQTSQGYFAADAAYYEFIRQWQMLESLDLEVLPRSSLPILRARARDGTTVAVLAMRMPGNGAEHYRWETLLRPIEEVEEAVG